MKSALLLAAALTAALPAMPAAAHPRDRDRYEHHHQGHWGRGGASTSYYRGHGYVVDNYRGYRLGPPPRGHHYVRDGDDVLLTVIATGIIAAVLADAGRRHDQGRGYDGYDGDRRDDSYREPTRGRSGVIQGPGGQTVWSESPDGRRTYTEQGPGGQRTWSETPEGGAYTDQGPDGQESRRYPPRY